jgi:hypothetical protein
MLYFNGFPNERIVPLENCPGSTLSLGHRRPENTGSDGPNPSEQKNERQEAGNMIGQARRRPFHLVMSWNNSHGIFLLLKDIFRTPRTAI